MFSLNDLDTKDTDKTTVRSDTGNGWFMNIPLVSFILDTAKAAFRVIFLRYMFFGVFLLLFFIFTGNFYRSSYLAENTAKHGVADDYAGLAVFMASETGFRSEKLNAHPFYNTEGARKLERKFEVKFGYKIKLSKLFAYRVYEDQDFLVMKSYARGKEKEKLDLDNWTLFGMSADDYCEDYFDGFVPNEKMEAYFLDKSFWRIRKIRNKENQNRFRCVIGPDTIEDYIDDDRQDN